MPRQIYQKMMKEINSAVDTFVKKNKDSIENAKLFEKLEKKRAVKQTS